MDQNSIIKSYKRVSRFYDMTFGQIFRPGQKSVINKMDCKPSDSVLEIGIGTGLSFKYYPDETKVIGIATMLTVRSNMIFMLWSIRNTDSPKALAMLAIVFTPS